MKGRRSLLRRGTVLGVLAAALVAGGVAYAAIPGSGGVYTACMLKHVGTLRLIDPSLPASNPMSHCATAFETQVTWNETGQPGAQGAPGPQGLQGPKGDTGPQGPAGADGVSHGYYATNTLTPDDDVIAQRVVGLSDLPAGTYAVFATLSNGGPNDAACRLASDTTPLNDAVDFPSLGVNVVTTLTGVVTTDGTNIVDVACKSQGSSKISGAITAILLDALN